MARFSNLEKNFDVVVIGGGIHGATAARALAVQGLSVALIEKDDFGGAASANSEKIIHGGLRYLQQLDIIRMRDSILARRKSLQLLPHLTHPSPFMVPTMGCFLRSKAALLAAMIANDVISFDRNCGVRPDHRIPHGVMKSKAFLQDVAEGLQAHGTGAAIWHDGFTENSERFTLAFVLDAAKHGAVVHNYACVEKILVDGSRVCGVRVKDVLEGTDVDVKAELVVNAAGGWLMDLMPGGSLGVKGKVLWTRAYNVIINKRLFGKYGVGLEAETEYEDEQAVLKRGKRNYFFAPWREGTIIGTMYKPFTGNPDDCCIEPQEIQDYLDEVNAMYPEAELTMDNVTFAHAGILPARPVRSGEVSSDPAKDTEVLDMAKETGLQGILVVKGVKYTTGVTFADRIARTSMKKLGRGYVAEKDMQVVGGGVCSLPNVKDALAVKNIEVDDEVLQDHLVQYGSETETVLSLLADDENNGRKVTDDQFVLIADVIHAVQKEHALQLCDVVFRRTGLGSFKYPGRQAIALVADVMGDLLDWSADVRTEQVSAVEAVYRKQGVGHVLEEGV